MKIDDMPAGREMDALVETHVMKHEVLGWTSCYQLRDSGEWAVPYDGEGEEDHPVYLRGCMCDVKDEEDAEILGHIFACLEVVPFRSVDIVAALEVIEKMKTLWRAGGDSQERWALFTCREGKAVMDFYASAGTLSLAISRAALKAAGVTEVEDE